MILFATRHGPFADYLVKRQLGEDNTCRLFYREIEEPDHFLNGCKAFDEINLEDESEAYRTIKKLATQLQNI